MHSTESHSSFFLLWLHDDDNGLRVSLCRGVDQKLKLLLDDANHYIQPQTSVADTGDGPFDRFADKKQITDFLQSECEKCVTKWVAVFPVFNLHKNNYSFCFVYVTAVIESNVLSCGIFFSWLLSVNGL